MMFLVSIEARYLVDAASEEIAQAAAIAFASTQISKEDLQYGMDCKIDAVGCDAIACTAE